MLLVLASPAFAQTSTPTPSSEDKMMMEKSNTLKTSLQTPANKERIKAFKESLSNIKDQRKKTIAENINEKISTINTRLTNQMTEALNKLSSILEQLSTKSQALKATGQNTASLDTAITTALQAVSDAKTAVGEQSQKEYSADITSDTTLKPGMSQMFITFRTDINSVFTKVKAAKTAVLNAVKEFRKIDTSNKQASGSANI